MEGAAKATRTWSLGRAAALDPGHHRLDAPAAAHSGQDL